MTDTSSVQDQPIVPAQSGALFKKLSEVMASVDRIPKRGVNKFHGYQYATEADVSDAVRNELAKRNVAVFVSSRLLEVRKWETPKGKPTLLTDVEVAVTFADGDSGETFTVYSIGTGDDTSDKGTYKAITGAVKYALMKTLLIPTGDDPEDDDTPSEAPRKAPARSRAKKAPPAPRLISEAKQKVLVEAAVGAGLDEETAKDRARNVTVDEYDDKLAALQAAARVRHT